MKMSYSSWVLTLVLSCLLVGFRGGLAQQCGTQAGGAICPGRLCCSRSGFCGMTAAYCEGRNCQSHCWPPHPPHPPPSPHPPSPPPPSPSPPPPSPPPPSPPPPSPSPPPPSPPPPSPPPPSPPPPSPPPPSPPPPPPSPPPPSPPPPPPSPPPPSPSPPPPSPPPPSPPPPSPSPPPPSPPPRPPPPPPQCGRDAGGATCPGRLCCSRRGFCGMTAEYCEGDNCQSQCWPPPRPPSPTPSRPLPGPPPSGAITDLITSEMFDQLLPYRNDDRCPAKNFYTYDAFVAAANFFPAFATTGDNATRIREVAAFLAQTSHETTGGWATAPGGPYAWGYCFVGEQGGGTYCVPNAEWLCAPGKSYYGRGPIQISYNYNYGPAGVALGVDLFNDPDLVKTNATISFETALWFWMTPQPSKPSCHDVITGSWTPSAKDITAGRLPGYGLVTNIINGGLECGYGSDERVQSRIGFYEKFCEMLGVSPGDNLDCGNQRPFGSVGVLLDSI